MPSLISVLRRWGAPVLSALRHLSGARAWAWVWVSAGVALCAAPALAQPAAEALWLRDVQQFTLAAARHAWPGQRIDVELGTLDARLRLAPCQRAEPYLPQVARLWGRSRIGLRCTQGASAWNVFVPVTVKVYGAAWVAAAPLPVGRVIVRTDLVQAEVDLAEETSVVVTEPGRAVGRALLKPLNSGQALRLGHLKAQQWFAAGDAVRVVARGTGFQAVGTGQALTPGIEGQPARVRTDSGRVVTGLPSAQGAIELTL